MKDTSLKTTEEIARRTLIVLAFLNMYLGGNPHAVYSWLEKHHLLPYLSLNENELITQLLATSILEERDSIQLGWYVELL